MKPQIFSEIAPLEKVLVYSPGDEHNHVLPNDIQPYLLKDNKIIKNENFLLFDDIIDLRLAKKQHQTFQEIINFYKKDSCINIRSFLSEIAEKLKIKNKYPLINLMYTRDIAVVIGNSILLTKSNSLVRSEENILSDFFFTLSHIYFVVCSSFTEESFLFSL